MKLNRTYHIASIASAVGLLIAAPAAVGQPANPEAAKVKSTEELRFQAWRAGDVNKLGPLVADDAVVFDGTVPMGRLPSKAAYLASVAAAKRAPTLALSVSAKTGNEAFEDGQTVRVFGADSSIAVVTGLIKDTANASDQGNVYSAVYHREGAAWKLLRYTVSGKGKSHNIFGQTTIPADASGDASSLSADEKKILDRMMLFLDSSARRILKNFDAVLADPLIYVHGEVGGHAETSKKQYIDGKTANPSAFPEVIAILNPKVTIYGANRDVAVVTNVRTDSTGGAALGIGFKPSWRSASDQLSVWIRSGPDKDDWRLAHLHSSPYISPPKPR